MKKEIKIDVIIPCYNEKDTIPHVIKNIQKQDISNLNIIIVDDNSNDGSKDFLKEIEDLGVGEVFLQNVKN